MIFLFFFLADFNLIHSLRLFPNSSKKNLHGPPIWSVWLTVALPAELWMMTQQRVLKIVIAYTQTKDQKSRFIIDSWWNISWALRCLLTFLLDSSVLEYIVKEIFKGVCSKIIYLPFWKFDVESSQAAAGSARHKNENLGGNLM